MKRYLAWAASVLLAVVLGGFSATTASASVEILAPRTTIPGVQRSALVIGNSAYKSVPVLDNTLNDAQAVADTAAGLGYRVYLARDVGRLEMNEVVSDFLTQIDPGSEVLFYYAGHGVELQGANYLFPVDVPMLSADQERLLRSEAISLSGLLQDFESRAARVTLVVLDACRDNPFAKAGTRSLGKTRGLGRVDPPSGTFVIYAAGAGETALDSLGASDKSSNGLFTRNLLKLMDKPGLELRSMVRELRQDVRQASLSGTGYAQTPSYYDQLLGDFYFRPKSAEPEREQSACETLVREDAAQENILFNNYTDIVAACERAVSAAPSDIRLAHLLDVAREQQAFKQAMTSPNRAIGDAYLRLFPNGRFRREVELRVASLGDIPPPLPLPEPLPSPQPPIDLAELTRALQAGLSRTGCYGGRIDGVWGDQSRKAVSEFARHASLDVPGTEPSQDLLRAIRPFDKRVCPLSCDARHEAKGDQCVLKICAGGQVLSRSGTCVARKVEHHRKKPVRRRPSGNCFTFNGSSYCE